MGNLSHWRDVRSYDTYSDLLVASENREQCKTDASALPQFLALEGHKASLDKLQYCQVEVK
jgi:hypothetical protein